MRFFNIGGPCNPEDHYMLPTEIRLDAHIIEQLIREKSYFILHAPRQTGKTTAIQELARQLTASGEYIGVVVSMEVGAAFPDNIGAAEDAILSNWELAIKYQLDQQFYPSQWKTDASAGQRVGKFLGEWSMDASRPLVVLIDEIDALQDQVLIV